jgi:hypothetical protein
VNLNESDHPINIIVTKFQKILLENVEQIKYKFRLTHNFGKQPERGRTVSKPVIVEVPAEVMEEERKTSVENMGPIPGATFY